MASVLKELTKKETRNKLRAFAGRNRSKDEKFGVMLQDETEEAVSVKGASYLRLIRMSGGFCPLLLVQIVMTCFIGC